MAEASGWTAITDYPYPGGWRDTPGAEVKARRCCEQLERGEILFLPTAPFPFPRADLDFLLAQRPADSPFHKNVSYKPKQDVLHGAAATGDELARLHDIMRRY